jgi:hypothetical protein
MATTTAGSHATEVTGAQLPRLIACATEAAATNTAATPTTSNKRAFSSGGKPGRQELQTLEVENAYYRTHIWSSRGPYTGDAW